MIGGRLSQLGRDLGWTLVGSDAAFEGVSTDSRELAAGALFVALKGEQYDGHDYIANAVEQGASGALVARECRLGLPQLLCRDTLRALGHLANYWRLRQQPQVIGITGSNGKTTVKEMLASILRRVAPCLATPGNFNNEVGLPLTLCSLGPQHRFAVLEMGAGAAGDIAYLASLAQPHIAVVTNAAAAHLEGMGSVAQVARVKGELIEALPDDGVAVINADDDYASTWRQLAGSRRIIDFGLEREACVQGRYHAAAQGGELEVISPEGGYQIALKTQGLHNARNALAAVAVAQALDIASQHIQAGLSAFEPVAGRLRVRPMAAGWTLIEDTYNANPASLRAGIAAAMELPGRHWLVLGDMAELGVDAEALHFQAGADAKRLGIERLFCIGELTRHCAAGFGESAVFFDDPGALVAALREDLSADVVCLVKGSRAMRMEHLSQALCGQGEG